MFIAGDFQTGLNQGICQQRDLQSDEFQVQQAKGIAHADPQDFPSLDLSQRTQFVFVGRAVADRRLSVLEKILTRLHGGRATFCRKFPQCVGLIHECLG